LFKALSDYVITEISEGDMCLCVVLLQQTLESLLRIGNFDIPFVSQNWDSSCEFFH